MALFSPNLDCVIVSDAGHDGYGQLVPGVRTPERCAIVDLTITETKTSVRADSSATRGNAEEATVKATILLTNKTTATLDSAIEVMGYKLRIRSVFPRNDLDGVLDHIRVTATGWRA